MKAEKINAKNMYRIDTPIGSMIAQCTEKGVLFLGFEDVIRKDKIFDSAQEESLFTDGSEIISRQLSAELAEYFKGLRNEFTVPLDVTGTPFRLQVWESLKQIPAGNTITYLEQSALVGDTSAVRAVAAANASNPVAILYPCHRVIGSNGKLTGYMGGIERKRWLLNHESMHFAMQKELWS